MEGLGVVVGVVVVVVGVGFGLLGDVYVLDVWVYVEVVLGEGVRYFGLYLVV